jgi:DnaK suppressor protein
MMTGHQLVEMEILLTDQIRQVEGHLANTSDATAAVQVDTSIGRLSRADAMLTQEMAKEARRRMEQRLIKLRHALARLDQGEFGLCVRCKQEIGFERLQIQAEALVCAHCAAEGTQARIPADY